MRLFHVVGGVALSAVVFLAPVRAQQPAPQQHEHTAQAPKGSGMGMMDQKMMADMKAADARLQSLVEQMKSAQGDARITAMQTLLTELVQNEVTMHQHMAMMHEHMMSQMPPK